MKTFHIFHYAVTYEEFSSKRDFKFFLPSPANLTNLNFNLCKQWIGSEHAHQKVHEWHGKMSHFSIWLSSHLGKERALHGQCDVSLIDRPHRIIARWLFQRIRSQVIPQSEMVSLTIDNVIRTLAFLIHDDDDDEDDNFREHTEERPKRR